MGNSKDREVGQGIACKILRVSQSGVFNEGWCLEGEEGSREE